MAGLSLKLLISDCTKLKRRKNAQKQGNERQPDNNRSRKEALASAKAAHTVDCFLGKVFCGLPWRTTFADVNKIKSFE